VKLITAHRILIGAAIAFFLVFAAITLVHGRAGAGAMAAGSVLVAIGLGVYYRRLSGWGRRP
jgi:hypothetical protein